jgi:hypothetical protein
LLAQRLDRHRVADHDLPEQPSLGRDQAGGGCLREAVAAHGSPWGAIVEVESADQESHAVLVLVGHPVERLGDPPIAAFHAPGRLEQRALEAGQLRTFLDGPEAGE